MERQVSIVESSSGQLVDAVIRPVRLSDKVLWTHWHEEMPPDAEDAHWEWDELFDLAAALPTRFEAYGLEHDGEFQGLRLLSLESDPNGIHAMRLSIAPWNRQPERRFRRVGRILVAVAILRSIELGHEGRFYCESLRKAEGFHRSNGMEELPGESSEGLKRFRMTAENARAFLNQLENEGLIRL